MFILLLYTKVVKIDDCSQSDVGHVAVPASTLAACACAWAEVQYKLKQKAAPVREPPFVWFPPEVWLLLSATGGPAGRVVPFP
ncbi:hypothetical protein CA264_02065 [Pontibacter actiniarum]|uniref:Uncharacterized protein n=1 Tax=Pontibacter actiniarum TaxID=323450 RepID=A0A1X9YN61_9BACT|nr:hypothetical protein CA264_02065 [Pontibacter actiniarum]